MKALVWRGTTDIRCETVPDPTIEHERDAIIKVTSCAICGSDLHLYDHFMPGMQSGDILGHETMGEVVEVGDAAKSKLKVGDRVVIPFTIICGECEQCKRGNFSVCEKTNRNKKLGDTAFGHSTAGLFGYTHLTGGYAGGQAEYLRVPFADATHIKVPTGVSDEKLLFLSDIFPTGWQAAVQCGIQPTDTVAIWGGGPVGQMAIRSAVMLGYWCHYFRSGNQSSRCSSHTGSGFWSIFLRLRYIQYSRGCALRKRANLKGQLFFEYGRQWQ